MKIRDSGPLPLLLLAMLGTAGCQEADPRTGEAHVPVRPDGVPIAASHDAASSGAALHNEVTALVGAHILDGTGAPAIEDGVVVVRDGRVAAAGPRSAVQIPADAEVIDLAGRWLVPGLVNSHGHVSGTEASFLSQLRQYAW